MALNSNQIMVSKRFRRSKAGIVSSEDVEMKRREGLCGRVNTTSENMH